MSIRSAIVLCRDKVTQSIGSTTPKDKTAYAKEAEFALSVLAEAMDNDLEILFNQEDWEEKSNDNSNDNIPEELDGVSIDENPEDETKEEKLERETARGFFG